MGLQNKLVMAWERPSDTEADRDAITALESTFARWQSVVLLGAFNFLWMLGWSWRAGDSRLATWLLPELWLLFAALPLCVALAGGQSRFWMAGAMALKVLLRSLPAMIGYLLTAVVAMALVRYAADLAVSHFSSGNAVLREVARGLAALVLAMLRGWLCLAAIFVMLRHGKQAALKEIYSDSEARHVAHDTAARSQQLCALQLELSTASGLR
jgi:hypothetical protein